MVLVFFYMFLNLVNKGNGGNVLIIVFIMINVIFFKNLSIDIYWIFLINKLGTEVWYYYIKFLYCNDLS